MPDPVYITKKPAKKPGRPTLMTPTRQALLFKAIEQGMPLKQAAELAGMSYDTLNHWQKRGESESAPLEFRQFCQQLKHAQAIAMQIHIAAVNKAAERDWRAAAWMLERRFPTEFARPQHIENSASVAKPLISHSDEDHEVLRRIKKQEGVRELMAELGDILHENRQLKKESAKIEAESKMLPMSHVLNTAQVCVPPARLRE